MVLYEKKYTPGPEKDHITSFVLLSFGATEDETGVVAHVCTTYLMSSYPVVMYCMLPYQRWGSVFW